MYGLRDDVFSDLVSLQHLHLTGSQIYDLGDNVISGLPSLRTLHLGYNQISDISQLSGLTTLNLLDLRGNWLNTAAYCEYVPLILAKNPGVDLRYIQPNPNPLTVDCSISLAELIVFTGHWMESGCGVGNNWCGGADLIHRGFVGMENFVELSNYY